MTASNTIKHWSIRPAGMTSGSPDADFWSTVSQIVYGPEGEISTKVKQIRWRVAVDLERESQPGVALPGPSGPLAAVLPSHLPPLAREAGTSGRASADPARSLGRLGRDRRPPVPPYKGEYGRRKSPVD